MADATPLSLLPNLGLKSAQMLQTVGIQTLGDLRTLGSVAAYAKTKGAGQRVSLNLLWALEGALTGEHWQDVARHHRASLLLALDEYERSG